MQLTYKLNENKDGLIVTGGEDLKGELNIPSEQKFEGKTYPVIKIENGAFEHGDRLTSLVIPSSVTEIEDSAFDSCSRLVSIVVAKGNEYYDSREDCNAIIETETNTLLVGCQSTIIPDSVIEIWDYAFSNCEGLESIIIPGSVAYIGECVFTSCTRLTSIVVAKGNEYYDSREGCNAIIETETNTLVAGCQSTVIPDSVTKIGDWAFWGCRELTSINIPNSVTKIGEGAFECCQKLSVIDLPDSLTKIGISAFEGCMSLTSMVIPDSVDEIGMDAFSNCEYLEKIVIGSPSLLTGTGVPHDAIIIDKGVIRLVMNALNAKKIQGFQAR